MNLSWNLGRVAGINLYLHPTFLLLLLYVGATQGGLPAMLLVSAVFGCVLLHELGHALTARRFGIGTADITLYPIGGVARLNRMPRKPGPELLIALAGPAVNLAIAAALWVALNLIEALGVFQDGPFEVLVPGVLDILVIYNLLLAGFNLIPAFPMDGGRVLRAILSGWLGRLRATEIAASLGRWLAVAFGFWSLYHGQWLHMFLAAFIFIAAWMELAHVRAEEGDGPRGPGRKIWEAPTPAGQRWVYQGNGLWRLAPVVVPADDAHRTTRPWI
jgi:Zn-dependent protease